MQIFYDRFPILEQQIISIRVLSISLNFELALLISYHTKYHHYEDNHVFLKFHKVFGLKYDHSFIHNGDIFCFKIRFIKTIFVWCCVKIHITTCNLVTSISVKNNFWWGSVLCFYVAFELMIY